MDPASGRDVVLVLFDPPKTEWRGLSAARPAAPRRDTDLVSRAELLSVCVCLLTCAANKAERGVASQDVGA